MDLSRLSRNYKENPLKRGEKPPKEDLEYLFIECNYSQIFLAEVFGRNSELIRKWCKEYGLKKDISKVRESANMTYQIKTGYDCPMHDPNVLKQMKNNYKEKTGYDHPMHNPECFCTFREDNPMKKKEIVEARKKDCREKTGKDWYIETDEFREKAKQTLLKETGYENAMQNPDVIQARKEKCLAEHGVEHHMKSPERKEKFKARIKELFGKENIMQVPEIFNGSMETRVDKYGDTKMFGTKSFQEESEKTCLRKYNVTNVSKMPETIQKINQTKRKNGTFIESKPEKEIKVLLEKKFNNVEYHYTSELYPFECDFYLPEKDLYIEYQGTWTHGKKPFEEKDEACIKRLEYMKQRATTSEFYQNAIYVWCENDVRKRETARKNNLNWIEFFNMKEFMEWYDKQT